MAKTEKNDRRSRRTERSLREALKSLIFEKGYDRVTVRNITDRADVGRSTFYAHFESKDNLHLSVFDELRDSLLIPAENGGANGTPGTLNFNSLPLFEHARENRRIYRVLANRHAGNMFLRKMLREINAIVLQRLQDSLPENRKNSAETRAVAHFYASSLVSTLVFWLDNDLPLSPEEINDLFKKLVGQGLEAFPEKTLRN